MVHVSVSTLQGPSGDTGEDGVVVRVRVRVRVRVTVGARVEGLLAA